MLTLAKTCDSGKTKPWRFAEFVSNIFHFPSFCAGRFSKERGLAANRKFAKQKTVRRKDCAGESTPSLL